jgi:hypothetical protein
MISFKFYASTSRENLKIQKLVQDVFQLSSASTLVFLIMRDAPASLHVSIVLTTCLTQKALHVSGLCMRDNHQFYDLRTPEVGLSAHCLLP